MMSDLRETDAVAALPVGRRWAAELRTIPPLLFRRVRSLLTLPVMILLLATAIYISYWSWLSIERFYALSTAIFDLGVNAQSMWDVYHLPWTPEHFVFNFFYAGWVFVVSPLVLARSYPLLLVVQSVFLAAGAFPLYGAARKVLGRTWVALVIGLGYLLYFPLAGINWFDFHFEAFFPFLFLSGYYFYVSGRYRWAALFLVLSGTVNYMYMLFPALFALTMVLEVFYDGTRIRSFLRDPRSRLAVGLLLVAIVFLAIPYGLGLSGIDQSTGGYLHDGYTGVFLNLDVKILTLFLLLAPLLFLPIFSLRGILLMSPYTYLLFWINFPPYQYPLLLSHQYTNLIIPGLMIGTIEGLRWLLSPEGRPSAAMVPATSRWRPHRRLLLPRTVVPLALGLVLLLTALVFQPYGPWNPYTTASFDLPDTTDVNTSLFADLTAVLSMIPANDSNVLLQTNLPQALPGKLGNPAIIPGLVGPTITMADIVNNSYPFNAAQPTSVRIDYAVADLTHTWAFVNPSEPGFPGMSTLLQQFLHSGYYGIKAEVAGIVLVVRGYHGPLASYAPFDRVVPATSLVEGPNLTISGSWYCTTNFNSTVGNSYAGTNLWFGPYLNLAPGSYVANYSLYTTDNRSSNFMTLDVSGNLGTDVISIMPVKGSLLVSHEWTTVSIHFNLTNFLPNVEFRGFTQNWTGTRCLSQVSLTQLQGGIPLSLPLHGQGVAHPPLQIPRSQPSVPSPPLEPTSLHAAQTRTGLLGVLALSGSLSFLSSGGSTSH